MVARLAVEMTGGEAEAVGPELDRHPETKTVAGGSPETTQTFLARVRQFLRLSA